MKVLAIGLPHYAVALASILLVGVAFENIDAAAGKTVWDGVYSAPQAQRGKEVYTRECLRCHGAGLEGTTGDGPGSAGGVSLSGDAFKRNWYSSSLNDLYDKIGKTMPAQPPTRTGKLAQPEVLDVMSFILSYNGFPAGTELTYQPELSVTDIVAKEGPEPVQTGETARAIGCLAAGDAANVWMLSKSTTPVKSRNTGLSAGPELERASATALGTGTIRLLNARPGSAPPGAKVEAKGRYVKVGSEDRLSVLSFQMLSPTCS
jgi:quinoprotein glucose dehydrogenase